MSWKVSIPGLGTVWIGEQYIPGRRSGLKSSEYRLASTSLLIWAAINSSSVLVLMGQFELSQVVGYN